MIKTGDITIYYTHLFGPIYGIVEGVSKTQVLFAPSMKLTDETISKAFPKGLPAWIDLRHIKKPQLVPSSS